MTDYPDEFQGIGALPEGWHIETAPTIELRDWFAGKVLPQAYAESRSGSFDAIARDAYAMADAMLKAREAKC